VRRPRAPGRRVVRRTDPRRRAQSRRRGDRVRRAHGAFTVEINPETTGALVDLAIALPAEDVLPLIAAR
jgi:hypothetical protein